MLLLMQKMSKNGSVSYQFLDELLEINMSFQTFLGVSLFTEPRAGKEQVGKLGKDARSCRFILCWLAQQQGSSSHAVLSQS